MKKLPLVLALATLLAGCAAPYPATPNYGTRGYSNDGQWQVVSVTPVPLGTGARVAASGQSGIVEYSPAPATSYSPVEYSAPPPSTVIVQQPVYAPSPMYVPAPVYAAPPPSYYWWPPISIGLGFSWSHHSGGGHYRGWGRGYGRPHR